jgi:hypothetical protein
MLRRWEHHYEFWCRHLCAQWTAAAVKPAPEPPVPAPAPEPREPIPEPPRATAQMIRGWDQMRAKFTKRDRSHLYRRR